MRELSRLTALTELDLRGVTCSSSTTINSSSSSGQIVTRTQARAQQQEARLPPRGPDAASVAATAADLARALPRLPALVSLSLKGDNTSAILPALTAAPAAGVNVLQQQLASLRLSRAACITPELIAALPATLTRLELQAVRPDATSWDLCEDVWRVIDSFRVSLASTPRLGQLTQLQRLDLKGIGLDGSEPGRLTALFSAIAQLTACSINGYSAVVKAEDATGKPELAEFLSAVACLTSLRSLEIAGAFRCVHWPGDSEDEGSVEEESVDEEGSEDKEDSGDKEDEEDEEDEDSELWWDDDEGEQPREPPADYAPLTAGLVTTSLTQLYLNDISLPQGWGPHMFGRPGLRLPQLHLVGWVQNDGGPYYCDRCLTADDVRSIFSCVEGGCLRKLTLEGVIKEWNAVDWGVGLSALTTLTYLSVDSSTKGVEQLTSLVALQLSWAEAPDKTLAAIARHLTRLTYFSAYNMALSERADRSNVRGEYLKTVGVGQIYECRPMPADECEELGEEELPVCEQLAGDLRAVGIRLPAAKRRKAAGGR